ncbi:hypothetical protein NEOLEDRAFT_1181089 [Neolentinus lepideus HHB14362 ss-1]|uniref:DUF6532 domain-containing protein n=1 Tax=Neolentinus lepideus HHB14362 ss-1 TaxID=1314782 RepID=A0A165QBT4_9AGAM|nr:hypothetical protein NEOLEDRAFT_1181089 [Neolentinus lepideus HHB14362 ss-1]
MQEKENEEQQRSLDAQCRVEYKAKQHEAAERLNAKEAALQVNAAAGDSLNVPEDDSDETFDSAFQNGNIGDAFSSRVVNTIPARRTLQPRSRNVPPPPSSPVLSIGADAQRDLARNSASPHPSLSKRGRSASLSDADSDSSNSNEIEVTKRPVRKRPRAADLDESSQEVLDVAIEVYRCRIVTLDPFPSHLSESMSAQVAWETACDIAGTELDFTRDIRKLKLSATSHSGIFQHKIIQKLINSMWYRGTQDEGVVYGDEFFKPFSLRALALVLTAIEAAIDEWESGIWRSIDFKAQTYKSVYVRHLNSLLKFADSEKDSAQEFMHALQTTLAENGRFNAGAPEDVGHSDVDGITADAFDAALEEFETMGGLSSDVSDDDG